MMQPLSIQQRVGIRQGSVLVDGEAILSSSKEGLREILKDWYQQLGIEYPKFFKMDTLCQLAFIGSEVLLKDAHLLELYPKEQIALVLSNSATSLDTDRRYHDTIKNAEAYYPSPAMFVYTLPSIMCGEIAIRNGFQGENSFLVLEQYEENLLQTQIALLFAQGTTQACIGGWVQVDGAEYGLEMFLALLKT